MAINKEVLNKIRNASNNAINARLKAEQADIDEFYGYYNKAKQTICPQVQELLEVINYAISKGYIMQRGAIFGYDLPLTHAPELCTDGVNHKCGLYDDKLMYSRNGKVDFNFQYRFVGIENGGCYGENDIFCSPTDIYWGHIQSPISLAEYKFLDKHTRQGMARNLEKFLERFDAFKEKVDAFVEHIDTYKCYL